MKISIITICYNSAKYIEQTILSVVGQTYLDKEYFLVDGGSTDGTVEIIKKYADKIDKWISEPDQGIADAMNKGLALATGDFVIFMHSDDYFVDDNILSDAVVNLSDDFDIFLFDIFLLTNGKKRLVRSRGLNWWQNIKTGIFHQSTFCARSLFARVGNFDTNLKIAMDYDFFLRAYRDNVKAKRIYLPLSVMRLCGVSSQLDWTSLRERFAEERTVHLKNCSSNFLRLVYFFYWILYPTYRYCKSRI